MGGKETQIGVIDAAKELESKYGTNAVEIFSDAKQENIIFNIDGQDYSWSDILDDFKNPPDPITGIPKYKKNGKYISEEEVPNTLMFKANKQWAEKLIKEGYTIIDIGNPNNLSPSIFYNLELNTIFP